MAKVVAPDPGEVISEDCSLSKAQKAPPFLLQPAGFLWYQQQRALAVSPTTAAAKGALASHRAVSCCHLGQVQAGVLCSGRADIMHTFPLLGVFSITIPGFRFENLL